MKKSLWIFTVLVLIPVSFFLASCESLRFAPDQVQKQNAWLHNRTTQMAARQAKNEKTSQDLQNLTELSELQSRAFVSYYGMPDKLPQADSLEAVLDESKFQLARDAQTRATDRPDAWTLADGLIEIGIGVSALLGGLYGTRITRFLKQAREKSQALKEIVQGNEVFKRDNDYATDAFKKAHSKQSPPTRKIVTELKSESN